MSTAVADAADTSPKKKLLSKKLVMMLAGALLLLAVAGGGAALWFKHKAAQQAEQTDGDGDAEGDAAADAAPARERSNKPHAPPTFVALEQFTVNLADKEAERFVQVGVSLEIEDAKLGEQIKLYTPAIRNGVLMILAHKTSQDLLTRSGKEQLAREIQAEVALDMGLESAGRNGGDGAGNPVRRVHFTHFIIQ